MVPAPLDQNLLSRFDRSGIARARVREGKHQLALLDAELPASRVFLCVGTRHNYAARQLRIFGLQRPQVRTQPESDGEWLVAFDIACIWQIQPGRGVHSHVRPEPYTFAPDYRTLCGANILQLGSGRRVYEGRSLLFVETQAHLQSICAD